MLEKTWWGIRYKEGKVLEIVGRRRVKQRIGEVLLEE